MSPVTSPRTAKVQVQPAFAAAINCVLLLTAIPFRILSDLKSERDELHGL